MMTISQPFRDAREVLGVGPSDDAAAIKRAYRRAVAAAPPDRDPDRFRRIRDAYELLCEPLSKARELLKSPVPLAPAPALPKLPEPSPTESLAVELLRSIVGALPLADFNCPPPARSERPINRASSPPEAQKRTSRAPKASSAPKASDGETHAVGGNLPQGEMPPSGASRRSSRSPKALPVDSVASADSIRKVTGVSSSGAGAASPKPAKRADEDEA